MIRSFRVIRSGRMRLAGHVARMGERRGVYRGLVGTRERIHFENLGVGVRIILKWTLKKSFGRAWSGLIWIWIGTSSEVL
jgi:hypothetical protein